MSDEIGVDYADLYAIGQVWRAQAEKVSGCSWHEIANSAGDGSQVLAAVRACAAPGDAALDSIATRLSTLAGLLDNFARHVIATDEAAGQAIRDIGARL